MRISESEHPSLICVCIHIIRVYTYIICIRESGSLISISIREGFAYTHIRTRARAHTQTHTHTHTLTHTLTHTQEADGEVDDQLTMMASARR
jgi:hypothetical protein